MAQNKHRKSDVLRAAKTGNPLRYGNLYVYPLTVGDYELLWECESALTIRLSSLPAIYACNSYAEALLMIAINGEDIVVNGDVVARSDEWYRFITILCASLKIPQELMKSYIQIHVDSNQKNRFKALTVRQFAENEENVQVLNSKDIDDLRKIIAVLNGKKLPDESENAELAEAEAFIRSSSGLKLDMNLDSLLASVARDQRCRIKDLYEWTIYEFELIRAAIERERRFTVCGIGECGGMVKFEKGNPYPSIFFDRPSDSYSVISASELSQRIGGAVQETSSLPENLPVIKPR